MNRISTAPSIALAIAAMTVCAQSAMHEQTQVHDYWVDPATKLMWAAKDNGGNVSWKGAIKYCRNLNLGGYAGWRMPNLDELQGLYDKSIETPGMSGDMHHYERFTWHIKGNIFLSGDQWTTLQQIGDRGKPSRYVYYFDFNEGLANNDPTGWPYPYDGLRVLCVRGPEAVPNHTTTDSGLIKIEKQNRELK